MKTHAQAATVGSPPAASRKARGLFGIACLCVLGLTAFLGSSAPSVSAAGEECPNVGALGAGFLPNCRAWEMVSPPEKNGGNIAAITKRTRAAVDGEAIQFVSTSGFADVKGSGVSFDYISRRTSAGGTNGWSTHAITPLQEATAFGHLIPAAEAEPRYVGEFAPDLSRGVFKAYSPVPTSSDPYPMVASTSNFYLADGLTTPGAASFELISDCPFCVTPLSYSTSETAQINIAGTNRGDATHEPLTNVLYEAPRRLTSDATNAQRRVYEGVAEPTDEYQTLAVDAEAGQFKLRLHATSGRGTLTSGSPTVTELKTLRGSFAIGQPIVGEGIPAETTILAVGSGTLTLSANATAGKLHTRLAAGPLEATADIAFDAPAAAVATALDALPSIAAPGSVSVTGGPGGAGATSPYVIGFTEGSEVAGTDMPQLEAVAGTTPLSGASASASAGTRLEGGQHVRLAGRVPTAPATACDDTVAPACTGGSSSTAGSNQGSRRNYAFNVVSDDGSRLIFRAVVSGLQKAYLREDGLRTIQLNASEATTPNSSQAAEYWTASHDGSRIFISTAEGLIDEDTNGTTDLYMYDASKPASAPDNLTLVSKGTGGSGGFLYVIGAGADGKDVYFLGHSGSQLVTGEPNVPFAKIYHWEEGNLAYVGGIGEGFNPTNSAGAFFDHPISSNNTARVSLDGSHLLFTTQNSEGLAGRGGFSSYDHTSSCVYVPDPADACREVFVYSAETGTLRCASCHPSGISTTPLGDALVNEKQFGGGAYPHDPHLSQAISGNGRYVFFHTGEPLVPEDTNGQVDAYVYDTQTEKRHLISSGESSQPSYFIDASDDGLDVFFATAERLSRWDIDTSYDIYDARAEGGLPEPSLPPPTCQGDACQPPPVALNDATPSSSSFEGQGNEHSARNGTRRRCPKGKRRVKARGGEARCVKRKRGKRGTNDDRRTGR